MGAPTDRPSGGCGRSGVTSNTESQAGVLRGRARILKIRFAALAGLRAETPKTDSHRFGAALATLDTKMRRGEAIRCVQALPDAVMEVSLDQARVDLPTVIELQGFAFNVVAVGLDDDPWSIVDLRSAWDVRDLSLEEFSVAR